MTPRIDLGSPMDGTTILPCLGGAVISGGIILSDSKTANAELMQSPERKHRG